MYRLLPGTAPLLNCAAEKSLTAPAAPSGVKLGIDQRDGHAGDGADLDGCDVVEDAASVREPGEVSAQDAVDVRASTTAGSPC